jgi:hypothetical protein
MAGSHVPQRYETQGYEITSYGVQGYGIDDSHVSPAYTVGDRTLEKAPQTSTTGNQVVREGSFQREGNVIGSSGYQDVVVLTRDGKEVMVLAAKNLAPDDHGKNEYVVDRSLSESDPNRQRTR